MRLEHHLVGGYVRYISPHIIIIIIIIIIKLTPIWPLLPVQTGKQILILKKNQQPQEVNSQIVNY